MFDPTIFDNIKVVLEGQIYEYDLNEKIVISNRQDLIDLALMNRRFLIQFGLKNDIKDIKAEIQLSASTEDLACEILEVDNQEMNGCTLKIIYYINISNFSLCNEIKLILRKIWGERPSIEQKVIYKITDDENNNILNETTLLFNRKINEKNIADIEEIIIFSIESLGALCNM